jgi:hypothetical protein
MKIYYFSDTNWEQRLESKQSGLADLFYQISDEIQTVDLVVVNYFLRHCVWNGGVAFARNWVSPNKFVSHRGRWKFTNRFEIPHDLPPNFKLIRLQFGMKNMNYPLCQTDGYGWKLAYPTFMDHVAFLFAHEFHHFRRDHLGLHDREGENSANRWAIDRVNQLGFQVTGTKLPKVRKKRSAAFSTYSRLLSDPYKKYRSLNSGDRLLIKYDPRGRYQGEMVSIKRPIRRNSKRIVIETADGKLWRWPLEWITI